jgi:exoribonuclease R
VPHRVLTYRPADGARLRAGLDLIRKQMEVPAGFPTAVMTEADQAVAAQRRDAEDRTDIPLVTIDPAASLDLDQAVHVERRKPGGYRVYYAIADVAAFVTPGEAVDKESHERGTTLYLPDGRAPLHPLVLSEGAASLLPNHERPALLWALDVDASGEGVSAEVRHARVRSRAKLSYENVQAALDAGTAGESLELLRDVGLLRQRREAERGGLSLPVPEQEVVDNGGSYSLTFRAPLPVEGWNAQISLMTGTAAAELMLYGEIGILRTLPEPPHSAIRRLRRVTHALHVAWPDGMTYGEMIRGLDPSKPRQAALLQEASGLLRGSGYTAFVGGVPERAEHAAVAAPYAHVTAPLRRLADRYAGEICVALCAGAEVPDWVRSGLAALPGVMEKADAKASAVEGACVSLVEAALLSGREDETFEGVVIDVKRDRDGGTVQIADPAVRGPLDGKNLPLGHRLPVRLVTADVSTRQIRFVPA